MKNILVSLLFIFLSLGFAPHTLAAGVSCGDTTCAEGQTCETIGGVTGCMNSNSGPNSGTVGSPSANGFVPLAPISNLTTGAGVNSPDLANFFNALYKYLIGASAVLAIIMIMWGGMEISTQDSIGAHSEGRERITQAILGLVIVLSPVLVFTIINPAILNLSIGLKPLDIPKTRSSGLEAGGMEAAVQKEQFGLIQCKPNQKPVCDTEIKSCNKNEGTPIIKCASSLDDKNAISPFTNSPNECPRQLFMVIDCLIKGST